MARTTKWKVYRDGKFVAACKYAEDAAALINVSSSGVVKYDHRFVVWREGQEVLAAGESYDRAADIMLERATTMFNEAIERSAKRNEAFWAAQKKRTAQKGEPIRSKRYPT